MVKCEKIMKLEEHYILVFLLFNIIFFFGRNVPLNAQRRGLNRTVLEWRSNNSSNNSSSSSSSNSKCNDSTSKLSSSEIITDLKR